MSESGNRLWDRILEKEFLEVILVSITIELATDILLLRTSKGFDPMPNKQNAVVGSMSLHTVVLFSIVADMSLSLFVR